MTIAILVNLSKAIDIALVKARRTPRARANFKRMMRVNERKLKVSVNEWLDWTMTEIRAGLPKMKGRTAAQRAKSIADWKSIKEQGVIILKPALIDVLADGGKSIVERGIRKQERFDSIGIEAVTWATKHSAELVTQVTDETIAAIRSYIVAGVDAGKSVPTIARELRPLVGLTEKNLWAVANYHEKLILDRPELTAARQQKMADVYARRLHRDRATMIARTETASSLNEGVVQGYGQMGIKRLEWVADPDCCDLCDEMNGKIFTVGEASGLMPLHVNCECSWVAA